jgi:hypothetical protein
MTGLFGLVSAFTSRATLSSGNGALTKKPYDEECCIKFIKQTLSLDLFPLPK